MSEMDRYASFTVVKGFIHGREKSARPVYGLFLGVSQGMHEYYLKTHFILEPVDREIDWSRFLSILNGQEEDERDEALSKYEEDLRNFISIDRVFLSEKKALDPKAIERKITYYCADDLDMSAVTFIDATSMERDELYSRMPFLKNASIGDSGAGDENPVSEEDNEPGGDDKNTNAIFIECTPVIDPIAGIPVSKLAIGQSVSCHLPEDSPFYKMCVATLPDFDGIVTGEVTGIKVNEFGNSVVAMDLADGITGAMKIPGNIWIKAAHKGAAPAKTTDNKLPRSMLFGVIGVIALICAILILFHYLT
jgi:hypothetical protein